MTTQLPPLNNVIFFPTARVRRNTEKSRHYHKRRVCQCAYTINNRQPVTCTIISDQPLFYMDYTPPPTIDELIPEGPDSWV